MGVFKYRAGHDEPNGAIPAGEYQLKVVDAVLGESKSGYPQAVVNFVVVNSLKYNGHPISKHYVTFIPEGQPGNGIAKAFLKALDLTYKGDEVVVNTDLWVGKILTAKVIIEPYDGNDYNKIKSVKKFEGAAATVQQEEEIQF